MKHLFLGFEESSALQGLGFNEECLGTINQIDSLHINGTRDQQIGSMLYDDVPCPIYSQALEFFRDNYNLLGAVYSNASGYLWEIHDSVGGTSRFDSEYIGDCEMSGAFTSFKLAEKSLLEKLIALQNKSK
jgi:hypothetical protein